MYSTVRKSFDSYRSFTILISFEFFLMKALILSFVNDVILNDLAISFVFDFLIDESRTKMS